ncbi:unnamed protein product, partial [Phaeothamnion confervicola]
DAAASAESFKLILVREGLLAKLEDICASLRMRKPPPRGDSTVSNGRDAFRAEEEAAAAAAAPLSQPQLATATTPPMAPPPPPFLYRGENYLLKMANDLNFLAGVMPLVTALRIHPAKLCRNPMMLPHTLDDQEPESPIGGGSTQSPRSAERALLCRAAAAIRQEELWEADRDRRRAAAGAAAVAAAAPAAPMAANGASSASGWHDSGAGIVPAEEKDDAADNAVVAGGSSATTGNGGGGCCNGSGNIREQNTLVEKPRLVNTSRWYVEATQQLIGLSLNNADFDYYRNSRRF